MTHFPCRTVQICAFSIAIDIFYAKLASQLQHVCQASCSSTWKRPRTRGQSMARGQDSLHGGMDRFLHARIRYGARFHRGIQRGHDRYGYSEKYGPLQCSVGVVRSVPATAPQTPLMPFCRLILSPSSARSDALPKSMPSLLQSTTSRLTRR